jgi:hypothetical protein
MNQIVLNSGMVDWRFISNFDKEIVLLLVYFYLSCI